MGSINENSLVEKSRFLLGMKAPNYELGELKILDTYLARINARDPNTQAVTFTKEEYESLMGFVDSRPETLRKRTEGLLGKVVTIPLEDGKKGWRKLTLFTKAECIQDEYGGYVVNLNCNPELQPIFFNIENAGYLRYRLKNILPLTSKHSMLLYLYVKDNVFRTPFSIDLKELRKLIGATQKSYDSFKEFRRRVLDKAIEEVNEKTDIIVSYERKTRGRLTVGLVFEVQSKATSLLNGEEEPEQITIDEVISDVQYEYENNYFELMADACDYEFDQEQMEEIMVILNSRGVCADSIDHHENQMVKHMFLMRAYKALKIAAKTEQIHNRYKYFKGIVEKISF